LLNFGKVDHQATTDVRRGLMCIWAMLVLLAEEKNVGEVFVPSGEKSFYG
jgi:hypothetical protein